MVAEIIRDIVFSGLKCVKLVIAAMLLLLRCYDIEKVKSLIDMYIMPLVRFRGGEPNDKTQKKNMLAESKTKNALRF